MSLTTTKLGSADHGRRMSLNEFYDAEVQEGRLYELGRGVVVVSDVPGIRHMALVEAIRDQLVAHKLAHPGRVYSVAAGSDCKIPVAGLESERHPTCPSIRPHHLISAIRGPRGSRTW